MTTEQSPHRFADALLSNGMLSSSGEALVRSSYWETCSGISRLDVQINDLLLRRRALCDYRQSLVALLSPVRRLPPELLAEIFRYCLPQNYYEEGAHKAVMLPSHICKHWRHVALSTPTLWTNIVLNVTDETFELQEALVTAWFPRSGGLPLSFTLQGQGNVRPILVFLLQYCNRWRCIDLFVPSKILPCLEAAKGHLQCLETLQIHVYDYTSSSVEHIFESAPRLRKVSLWTRSNWNWNSPSGSWAQLMELDAGLFTVGDCLALLQSTRNLQKLTVTINGRDVEGHRRLVSHPLVSLVVRGWNYGMFFDHITFPSLRDLSVGEMDSAWPQSQFISFLTRSSPPLQSFSLRVPHEDDEGIWDDNMIQIIQHIPSLHSLGLVFNSCEVDGHLFFKRLSPRILDNGQVDCLIPKLHTISIKLYSQLVMPDYRALTEMIISRCSLAHNTKTSDNISGPIEQIQKVRVEYPYDEDSDLELEDDATWHERVSQMLAPLQGVVDVVQIVEA